MYAIGNVVDTLQDVWLVVSAYIIITFLYSSFLHARTVVPSIRALLLLEHDCPKQLACAARDTFLLDRKPYCRTQGRVQRNQS
jgi:hypothetical protein